jgi:predicted CXXCH cytochrome family protein
MAEQLDGGACESGTVARHAQTSRRSLLSITAVALALGSTAVPGPRLAAQDSCTACHGNRDFIVGVAGDSARGEALFVDVEEYAKTVHGGFGFACTLCHSGVGDYPHAEGTSVHCGDCHATAEAQLAGSVHGTPNPSTGERPAECADCHTEHDIRRPTDPESSVYRLTQFVTCARCHEDAERMGRFGQENVTTVSTYLESVHGHGLLEKGLTVAPVCTDCHGEVTNGAHTIVVVGDSASRMHRTHVVETCGRCHAGIMARYDRGIHGELYLAGNPDTPTCVSCHAEHGVRAITSPESGVNPQHIAQTCTGCHDTEEFNQKYGVATARGQTFSESFHGVALEAGQVTVANCESCHGAHEILPSSDPRSMIYPANLQETCGKCHQGIGAGVAEGQIHVASLVDRRGSLGWVVTWAYILIIGTTILYSLGLIFLDQYRHWVVEPRRGGGHHG